VSTYLNKAQAEKVLEILHRNGLGCHPCTFTRDAMDSAAAVLRKEVRASEKLETLERELAEAKADAHSANKLAADRLADLKDQEEQHTRTFAALVNARAELVRKDEALRAAMVSAKRITAIRWGHDGSCMADDFAEDIIEAATAALAQGGKEGA
jgi:hypothetical protein